MPDIFSGGGKVFVEGEDPQNVLSIEEDPAIFTEGVDPTIDTDILDSEIGADVDPSIQTEILETEIADGDVENAIHTSPFEFGDIFTPERTVYVEIGSGDDMTEDQKLVEWAQGKDWQPIDITRDSEGIPTTATVIWPDDSTGVYTALYWNATHECYDGYSLTHVDSSKTITQPSVTRDSEGAIIYKPEIIVS